MEIVNQHIGFLIKSNNKVLGISGDSRFCSAINEIVKSSNLSILDISFISKGQSAHMGLEDVYQILNENIDKKIIPTHMHDDTKEMAMKQKNDRFIVLNDGEEIEL